MFLVVFGQPRGKDRPRFVRATGRTYTTSQTKTAESRWASAWEHAGREHLEGPLGCLLIAAVSRPAGHFRVNGELSKAGLQNPWPCKKPDLDNLIKLALDSLNGLAYRDDAQIVEVRAVRRWCQDGERDHVSLEVEPIGTEIEIALLPVTEARRAA